jgi:hypothetical protein
MKLTNFSQHLWYWFCQTDSHQRYTPILLKYRHIFHAKHKKENSLNSLRDDTSVLSDGNSKSITHFLDFLTLEDGTETCPETSVKDYHSTLLNTPEARRSHQHPDESPKSRQLLTPSNGLFYKKKVKFSLSTPWRHLGGGEEVQLNLGTRWR